jgi:hypothetical protein
LSKEEKFLANPFNYRSPSQELITIVPNNLNQSLKNGENQTLNISINQIILIKLVKTYP